MKNLSPSKVVESLIEAINSRDLKAAINLYQEDAIFYAQPDQVLYGKESIGMVLGEMLSVSPKIITRKSCVIEKNNIAIYMSEWEMSFIDPDGNMQKEEGSSADVLVCNQMGEWSIAIDNPWGLKISN